MATEVKLPRLGQGMESGTIVRWLKSEGEQVAKGEPLYELDTDKVTQEVEAEASGVLLKIAIPEGEVEVGRTIAFIGKEGESVAAVEAPAAPAPKAEPASNKLLQPEPERVSEPTTNGRIKASPLARRLARERGIDLSSIQGTGPDGRIVAQDVETPAPAASRAPAPVAAIGEVTSQPLTNIRKTIARRLTEAWTVPVFTLTVSADMTRANQLVASRRELDPDVRVTVTDLLTRVCAQALARHPEMNVQYTEDALLSFPNANVGIAVAAPQGLVVPVVHNAEQLTLVQIAQKRGDLVARARDSKLRAEDIDGGTFTISNLGMFDVDQFVAVLNPPQASILAVGVTREQVVPRDGELVVVPLMTMTLTCDHRAVDGATGAEFLKTVKAFLEFPGLAL
ncbi:MAG TPA: dihydrolipoamide acetyltransferase family protein [Gaiellaceae bacterium]|nr:dihydrolipoamide acetyltransferase family protein [Gaiellaceae bacterium]